MRVMSGLATPGAPKEEFRERRIGFFDANFRLELPVALKANASTGTSNADVSRRLVEVDDLSFCLTLGERGLLPCSSGVENFILFR